MSLMTLREARLQIDAILDALAEATVPIGPSLVNEYGRVECAACNVSVLPENWSNHVLGKTHEAKMSAGALTSWKKRQRALAATPSEPEPPDHVADGSPCWCQPTAERQPDGSFIYVHKGGEA